MPTIKFLFRAFRDTVAAILIGTAIGYFVGYHAGTNFRSIRESDLFTLWRSLDRPVSFTQIVEATPDEIMAKSTEGNIYKANTWLCYHNGECNWVETKGEQLYKDELYEITRKATCPREGFPRYKPGDVLECVSTYRVAAEYGVTVNYVILKNGTIWYLLNESSWYPSYDGNIRVLRGYTLLGALAGIIAGSIIVFRKEMGSKYE